MEQPNIKQIIIRQANILVLIFLAIVLISFSIVAGQVAHEQTHLKEARLYNESVSSVCYLGYLPNSHTTGWVALTKAPFGSMDENKSYMYKWITLVISLIISLIVWLRVYYLMYGGNK